MRGKRILTIGVGFCKLVAIGNHHIGYAFFAFSCIFPFKAVFAGSGFAFQQKRVQMQPGLQLINQYFLKISPEHNRYSLLR